MEFNKEQALKGLKEYVMTGAYAERSECDKNSKKAKDSLKSILLKSDEKRHEYILGKQKIIAKFIREEIRETDHAGLIIEILDYVKSEALSQVITLNKEILELDNLYDVVKEYQYTPTYYTKYTPNKYAKSFNYTVSADYYGMSEEELISSVMFNKERKELLDLYNKRVTGLFLPMEEKSLKTDVGTITKIKNKPVWDIHQISQKLGNEFLEKYGTVKLTELQKWLDMGAIPRQILSDHQQVIDIRLKFTVLTEESEQRSMNAYQRMQNMKSELRYA